MPLPGKARSQSNSAASFSPADDEHRAEQLRGLLDTWLRDESGYDEVVWPELKTALERDRLSTRPLFGE